MGFYGNISNIGKTNMTFDIIYPNRFVMDNNVNEDGVYAGRYVLIEYDTNYARDTFIRFWVNSEQNNQGTGVDAYYADSTKTIQMNFKEGPIYERMNTADSSSGLYYRCIDEESQTIELLTNAFNYPKFMIYKEYQFDVSAEIDPQEHRKEYDAKKDILYIKIDGKGYFPATSVRNSYSSSRTYYLKEKDYTINYNKDIEEYGASYDSSVWVKQYKDGVAKYIRIAELNSVIPTFDIMEDAPSMIPVAPYFDTSSTNLHYTMHMQSPWAFRVAEKSTNALSDENTLWSRQNYNNNGEIITEYYDYNNKSWQEEKPEESNIPASIYYNKAAFDPQVKQDREETPATLADLNKKVENDNCISISLAKSGKKYPTYEGGEPKEKEDIQEISISLPIIGNIVSDALDIIHGEYRNNSKTTSLQGRLDSFAALQANTIPIVNKDNGGELVGKALPEVLLTNFTSEDGIDSSSIMFESGITLGTALNNIQKKFAGLDYSKPGNSQQVMTSLTQTDGKITAVDYSNIGELQLTGYEIASSANLQDIQNTNTVNTAFGITQKNINLLKEGIGAKAENGNKATGIYDYIDNEAVYAGSSTHNGSATSAVKLDIDTAGSTTQPVYFSGGKPVAITYELNKTVPSDAEFTDTTYSVVSDNENGLMSTQYKKKLDSIKDDKIIYSDTEFTYGENNKLTIPELVDKIIKLEEKIMTLESYHATTTE